MNGATTNVDPGSVATSNRVGIFASTPALIRTFLIGDILIALAGAVNSFCFAPMGHDYYMLHLGDEQTIPTWYSSVQLFTVGLLLAGFAWSLFDRRDKGGGWAFMAAAALFFCFSLDEIAEIHELLGRLLDHYTHFESRPNSLLAQSGPWMLVCVPLVLAGIGVLAKLTRPYWRAGVAVKYAVGFAVFIGSAAGLELLSNVMVSGAAGQVQVLLEETGEMLGATVLLWASCDLLRAHGVDLFHRRR